MKVLTARVLLLASLLAAIPLLREERAPALEPPLVARPSVARLGTVTVNPTNASSSPVPHLREWPSGRCQLQPEPHPILREPGDELSADRQDTFEHPQKHLHANHHGGRARGGNPTLTRHTTFLLRVRRAWRWLTAEAP